MSAPHVRVRVAGEHYALPVASVLEVAELEQLTPVPGGPAAVLGVCNLHGAVLPVVDLAALVRAPGAGRPQRLVVAEDGARRAGLAVEDVLEVEVLPEPAPSPGGPHLSGAALVDGEAVGVLDVESVLASAGVQS
jgi:purine-binding chemotaxis protein CheW